MNKKNISRNTKKNKGGNLSLPGSSTFSFDGSSIGSWVNGLGVPAVLIGARELMKGSKKNKHKGGQLNLPGSGTFNFAGQDVGSWVNGLGVPAVLLGARQLMKGSKKNKNKKNKKMKGGQ